MMSEPIFDLAYKQQRSRYADVEWFGFTPQQISELLRDEIRLLEHGHQEISGDAEQT